MELLALMKSHSVPEDIDVGSTHVDTHITLLYHTLTINSQRARNHNDE